MKFRNWIILGIIIAITLWILLYYQWIIVLFPNQQFEILNAKYWIMIELLLDVSEYNENNLFNQPNFIFTIINGLLMGIYVNDIGLMFSTSKRNALILFLVIWLVFNFIGLFGFRITLNFPFLVYKSFTTNTSEGGLFFLLNVGYFVLVFILSHLIEGDTHE